MISCFPQMCKNERFPELESLCEAYNDINTSIGLNNCYLCENVKNYRNIHLEQAVKEMKKYYNKYVNNSIVIFRTDTYLEDKTKNKSISVMPNNLNAIFSIIEEDIEYKYYPAKYIFYSDGKNVRCREIYEREIDTDTYQTSEMLFRKIRKEFDVHAFEEIILQKGYELTSKEIDKYTESILPLMPK